MNADTTARPVSDDSPYGRYKRSLFDRSLAMVLAATVLIVGTVRGLTTQPGFRFGVVPLLIVLLAVIWLVPVTTIDKSGVKVLPRKHIPWSDVIEASLVGPKSNVIRLRIADGRQATLYGVPPSRLDQIQLLVSGASSRP